MSLAAHFIHEWLHVIGFYHFPGNEARNDVAYNVGNAVEKLLREEQDSIVRADLKERYWLGRDNSELKTSEKCLESGCGQCGKEPEKLSAAEEDAFKK